MATKVDIMKYDLVVTIAGDRRAGSVWASSLTGGMGLKGFRNAGRVPFASGDSLLLVAMNAALRGLGRLDYEKIRTRKKIDRPRVCLIVCGPSEIVDAINTGNLGTVHAARQIIMDANRVLNRFDITAIASLDSRDKVLLNWGKVALKPSIFASFDKVPTSLQPTAYSQAN